MTHSSGSLLLEHDIWRFRVEPDPHGFQFNLQQPLLFRALCGIDCVVSEAVAS